MKATKDRLIYALFIIIAVLLILLCFLCWPKPIQSVATIVDVPVVTPVAQVIYGFIGNKIFCKEISISTTITRTWQDGIYYKRALSVIVKNTSANQLDIDFIYNNVFVKNGEEGEQIAEGKKLFSGDNITYVIVLISTSEELISKTTVEIVIHGPRSILGHFILRSPNTIKGLMEVKTRRPLYEWSFLFLQAIYLFFWRILRFRC